MFGNVLNLATEAAHSLKTPPSGDSGYFSYLHTPKSPHSDSGIFEDFVFPDKEAEAEVDFTCEQGVRARYRIIDERTVFNLPYSGLMQDLAQTQIIPSTSEFRSRLSRYDSILESHLQNDSYKGIGVDEETFQPKLTSKRRKRQRVSAEEAKNECRVCGKRFTRTFNWKSHMETHHVEGRYPHLCTAMVGQSSCDKKFLRKTDLDRHYDKVSSRYGTKAIKFKL